MSVVRIILALSIAAVAGEALTQEQAEKSPLVRIRNAGHQLDAPVIQRCVAALQNAADRRGLRTRIFNSFSDEWQSRPKNTIDLSVSVASSDFAPAEAPRHQDILTDLASFRSISHLNNFFGSAIVDDLLSDTNGLGDLFPDRVVNYAYGSAAHVLTNDKPVFAPMDLRGRTMVGAFGAWWYASMHRQLGIGHNPVLGHTRNTVDEQRTALLGTLGPLTEEKYFVVLPMHVAAEIVPPEYAKYFSLTMTHVSFLSFKVEQWKKMSEGYRSAAIAMADEARYLCSQSNFEAEKETIEKFTAGGSEFIPVDTAAFINISQDYIKSKVSDAKQALRKAEGAKKARAGANRIKVTELDKAIDTARTRIENARQRLEIFEKIQRLEVN